MAWYFYLLGLLILLMLFLLTSISIETEVKENKFNLSVKVLGIRVHKYKNKSKSEKIKKEKNPVEHEIKNYIDSFYIIFGKIKQVLKYLNKKIICKEFVLDITFGLNDAAQVGVLTGMIWSAIGTFYPFLDSALVLKKPVINVNPLFNKEYFSIYYKGIYKLKIIHIIYIYFKNFSKIKKLLNKNEKAV